MDNLDLFVNQVTRAYAIAARTNKLSGHQVRTYGLALEQTSSRKMPKIRLRRRLWRKRVARMVNQNFKSQTAPNAIDWSAIWQFILENIVPILETLLPLTLLFI